ncbi:hypothetical protein SprV_0902780700 [Sparganum proliferum]
MWRQRQDQERSVPHNKPVSDVERGSSSGLESPLGANGDLPVHCLRMTRVYTINVRGSWEGLHALRPGFNLGVPTLSAQSSANRSQTMVVDILVGTCMHQISRGWLSVLQAALLSVGVHQHGELGTEENENEYTIQIRSIGHCECL